MAGIAFDIRYLDGAYHFGFSGKWYAVGQPVELEHRITVETEPRSTILKVGEIGIVLDCRDNGDRWPLQVDFGDFWVMLHPDAVFPLTDCSPSSAS